MSFSEFIGFLVTMAAMIYIMARRGIEEARKRRNPQQYGEEDEREQTLKDFLESLDADMEKDKKLQRVMPKPAPPPKKAKPQVPKAPPKKVSPEDRFKDFTGERIVRPELRQQHDAYAERKHAAPCRARKLIDSLSSPRDMIILHEILSKPKGLE